ncbi:MAG: hypothetical protein GY797_39005 [Deltaproteobacteria bacterium]|nr:hypothetical protein [Deltaproteobacteria bacterium]
MDNECPKCGGESLYQDRVDLQLGQAHCDDCGETISEEEYLKIVEEKNV